MGLLDYPSAEYKQPNSNRLSSIATSLLQAHDRKKQPRKKVKFVPPTYEMWINSVGWKRRRERYWLDHGIACAACGSIANPTVHHTHYGYLGRETDSHIVGLCWNCHKEFHDRYGTSTVMQEQTAEFVADKKMGTPTFV